MMHIDHGRVEKLAAVVAALPEDGNALDFHGYVIDGRYVPAADMYPPLDHPSAIEFFFFVCLHQHGFWHGDGNGYAGPLYGTMGGKRCKGSDLLWKVCLRALHADPEVFSPKRLSAMSHESFVRLFSDDDGPIAFPDPKHRFALSREYGRRMQEELMSPAGIVSAANGSRTGQPLADFLGLMKGVHGFGDLLRKKSLLLALALSTRPERFLVVTDPQHWKPIVDYHLMRLALRTGLVTIDGHAAGRNAARAWVDKETEIRIRALTYAAVDLIMRRSGRTLAVVDHAFWSARRFCPEMEKPDCDTCVFASGCAKRTELFQPVHRSTDY